MRKRLIVHDPMKLLGAAGLLLAALLLGQPAVAQVVTSKHNLSSSGTGGYVTSSTAEVCVFCHTPHGASANAPLWNKGGSGATYTLYSSATLDSTLLAVGSISAACLSCHDGVGGLDNLINAPGSGGYTAGGASQSYSWTTGTNQMAAGTITNIGADLTNDHPIGAAYCAGFTATDTCKDVDFKLTALNRNVGGTITTGAGAGVTTGALTDQYWIDNASVGSSGVREKTDVILYTRAFTIPAGNFPSVECGSCHDPHSTTNGTFLRVSNAASALCTTCHNK